MEKGDQGKEDFRDRISELTDEILFIILSFLTLKEVANICFLSRRLKILWPLIVALNFDASNTLGELRRNGRLRKKKRTWYINWRVRKLELDFEEVAEETWPPGGNLDDEPAFAFCPLSGYLCQLKTLTLEMSAYNMTFPNFPEVTNLKHLAVSA
ncbi:hypothetical protein V6Z11_A03G146600 [Gossypium hirsutum]